MKLNASPTPPPALHVLMTREEIDPARLLRHARVVVVLDVLFATTSIVHALASGATGVWPARDADEAQRIANTLPAPLLAGERRIQALPGFGPATPVALAQQAPAGRPLVYCTTNGTVALRQVEAATAVYAGALTNGAALAAHITSVHAGLPVLLVCAGSTGSFNLEDFYGAGHLLRHLLARADYSLTDAARAARLFGADADPLTILREARVGRLMQRYRLDDEVACAARLDAETIVPRLFGDHLRHAAPGDL